LGPNWSVEAGSASISGGKLILTAGSAVSCDVTSIDGTPYGTVLANVCFPAASPTTSAVRLCCNLGDADNYAFAEYRADGTVHVGTRSGGADTYAGTWFQADAPVLGTMRGGIALTTPLPLQLCYTPTGIIATAQYRADGFDANMVGAGLTATITSSKCAVATNAAATSGAQVFDFRLLQSPQKKAGCAACAPACGQWKYSDVDAILSYNGLCNLAPEQFIVDLGAAGLTAGVTGVMPDGSSTQPCAGCTGLTGEYTLEFCPWDATGADHDPAPWGNGQCYPAHPVPPTYYGAPNVPGGQCKWCYYGDAPLCDNDTLFQAGMGIFPVISGGVLCYRFQVISYISSLPIPNPFGTTYYNQMLWQATYLSAPFALSAYPNCTDPLGSGHALTLDLSASQIVPWFGGQICGNPWSSITLRY
jgi:hypothetical protein